MNLATITVGGTLALLGGLGGLVVAAAGAVGDTAGVGAAAAAAACAYAYPDAERAALAIEATHPNPVDAAHWDTYRVAAGMVTTEQVGTGQPPTSTPASARDGEPTTATTNPDAGDGTPVEVVVTPIAYDDSTTEQRHQLLVTMIRRWFSEPDATVNNAPAMWWLGYTPNEDTDPAWTSQPVPGTGLEFDDYISAYLDAYVTVDIPTTGEPICLPPHLTNCPQPINTAAALATIRALESGNNYTENSRSYARQPDLEGSGWPSGAYQYLRSSWNNHAGYTEAWRAPANVQDERATRDVQKILATYNDVAWVPISWYVGPSGAAAIANGTLDPNQIPNPKHNSISPADYQTKWMEHYTTIALPLAGVDPIECPTGNTAVIAWAETQLGAPYAATHCCRFGTPWPGGAIPSIHDTAKTYQFGAGTITYDCSGFVVAAWLNGAGIDLRNWGLYGSQTMGTTTNLETITATELAPGDLIVYGPSPTSGIGHVGMYHHTEPDGTIMMINASPNPGVTISPVDWTRVTHLKRVPIPDG